MYIYIYIRAGNIYLCRRESMKVVLLPEKQIAFLEPKTT